MDLVIYWHKEKMMRNWLVLLLLAAGVFAARAEENDGRTWPAAPGAAEVCVWADDALAAVSLTIDDNCGPNHAWWLEMAKKYDVKLTWFVIVKKIDGPNKGFDGTWEDYRKILEAGHDVQSHSFSHSNKDPEKIDFEYAESQKVIEEKLPGHKVEVIAYPGGGKANDPKIAEKYYFAARGVVGTRNIPGKINYMNVGSQGGIPLDDSRMSIVHTINPQRPRDFHAWTVSLQHLVKDDGKAGWEKSLAYIKENRDKFWVETFRNCAKYGMEREKAKVESALNGDKITVKLTADITDKRLNYPLTVKVCLPDGWKDAEAVQGGQKLTARAVTHGGKTFALVGIVPNAGDVVLSKK